MLTRLRAVPWILEGALLVACIAFSTALALARAPGSIDSVVGTRLDLAAGVVAALLLLARHRALIPVALTVAALGTVTTSTAPSAAVLQFLVGSSRPARTAGVVVAANVVASVVSYWLWMADASASALIRTLLVAAAIWATLAGLGAAMRLRGMLVTALRDQAETARLRARDAERARIAREMHDVVAQQIAVVIMQIGALTHRRSLRREEMYERLDAIAERSRTALDDLHAILRILRTSTAGSAAERSSPEQGLDEPEDGPPQPDLTALPGLLDDARAAGVAVEAHLGLPTLASVPAAPGRTVYRVAQEALTNAAKHAPGAPVVVCLNEIDGPAGAMLSLTVHNTVHTSRHGGHATVPPPGSGTGLIGVRERVELAGGTVHACGIDNHVAPPSFRLEVSVPCTR